MNRRYIIVVLITIALLSSSCSYVTQGVFSGADRSAIAMSEDYFGDSANEIVYLDQNWDRWDSLWFYTTTQGSDFMPYDLFLHLELADGQALFRNDENISKYRYMPQAASSSNPDALPVGFVKDSYQGKDYMGFTCAACHTGQINYKGTGIRIDGGPAMSDMDSFLRALEVAMQAAMDDEEKLTRLANNLSKDVATTKSELSRSLNWLKSYNQMNLPVNGEQVVHYGYGRLDAFGRIFNRVLGHMTPGDVSNSNSPNAPVSYPFLWDTPQHDYVQWNGVANNNEGPPAGFLGPLGRNTGEVLGVFADFSLEKQDSHLGYQASVDKNNLGRLERHLIALQSPLWPEDILPPINKALAEQGGEVFDSYKCSLCHSDDETFVRDDNNRLVVAQFSSVQLIGTDPQMATNALTYQGKSGMLNGRSILIDGKEKFGETTPVVFALSNAAQNVILARDPDKSWIRGRAEWLWDVIASFIYNPVREETNYHLDFEIQNDFPNNLNAYKARPLNGIWATAPYLHNGSIPNLYELFLPKCSDEDLAGDKKCRSNKFTIGSREFDPAKVGLVNKDKNKHPGLFEYDTSLPGNSNAGHEYAVGVTAIIKVDEHNNAIRKADGSFEMEWLPPISDQQRLALVEYLKTL